MSDLGPAPHLDGVVDGIVGGVIRMGDSDLSRQAPALLEALAQPLESTLDLALPNAVAGMKVGEVFDVADSNIGISARVTRPTCVMLPGATWNS